MIEDENCSRLFKKIISQLSELEECVFLLKIQNFTYQEIANILDKDEKSIDNTMQRIRLKTKKIMALL
jgi:DNA-directed RNA polymerase specialized sigma24 family protein